MTVASDALVAAAQALTEALRASAVDPADGVRLLVQLIQAPAAPVSSDATTAAAQGATATMLRRCAFGSLAQACAQYQPATSNEALALVAQVGALFDAEILVAADAGERDVYTALRALRTAVAQDLTTRALNLPSLLTVTVPQPEPSLVLAMRLYGDSYREPGLVARADVVNPLFMPIQFEALSS